MSTPEWTRPRPQVEAAAYANEELEKLGGQEAVFGPNDTETDEEGPMTAERIKQRFADVRSKEERHRSSLPMPEPPQCILQECRLKPGLLEGLREGFFEGLLGPWAGGEFSHDPNADCDGKTRDMDNVLTPTGLPSLDFRYRGAIFFEGGPNLRTSTCTWIDKNGVDQLYRATGCSGAYCTAQLHLDLAAKLVTLAERSGNPPSNIELAATSVDTRSDVASDQQHKGERERERHTSVSETSVMTLMHDHWQASAAVVAFLFIGWLIYGWIKGSQKPAAPRRRIASSQYGSVDNADDKYSDDETTDSPMLDPELGLSH